MEQNKQPSISKQLIARFNKKMQQLTCIHIWSSTNSRRMASKEMNTCIFCGIEKAGPDPYG